MQGLQHVVQHFRADPGIDADPEHLVHDEIGVLQRPDHAKRASAIGRLADQVAAEQQPRRDLALFQILRDLVARERRAPAAPRSGSRTSSAREPGVASGRMKNSSRSRRPSRSAAKLRRRAAMKPRSFSSCATPTAACMSVSFRL